MKSQERKKYNECLKWRLDLWKDGDFDKLTGNVKYLAMRLLSENNNGGLLPINYETVKPLKEKHIEKVDVCDDMFLEGP